MQSFTTLKVFAITSSLLSATTYATTYATQQNPPKLASFPDEALLVDRGVDWLCNPDTQECGRGEWDTHYCNPNKCTGWHGCIPYTAEGDHKYAWCS
ncbi:unnamed protein product [Cercospora beticola]|nr:unnamed protein product [Cercospora beticola]